MNLENLWKSTMELPLRFGVERDIEAQLRMLWEEFAEHYMAIGNDEVAQETADIIVVLFGLADILEVKPDFSMILNNYKKPAFRGTGSTMLPTYLKTLTLYAFHGGWPEDYGPQSFIDNILAVLLSKTNQYAID